MIIRIILFLVNCIFLNQNQVGVLRSHLHQSICKAALGKQSVHDLITFECGCKFFGLSFFLQSGIDRHIHRFCMVFALAKEQPLMLIVYCSNVNLRVTLVVVAPVRANA